VKPHLLQFLYNYASVIYFIQHDDDDDSHDLLYVSCNFVFFYN